MNFDELIFGKSVMERFNDELESYRESAEKELDERYELCNEMNHVQPLTTSNECFYCFRHLDYTIFDNPEEQKEEDREKGLFKIMFAMRELKI